MTWKIPLFKMYWDENDVRSSTEAIETGMNWAIGPNVDLFEKNLAEYTGSKYCSTYNSGTSALHALLLAAGIGKGDEVIVPSFTFIATANSPLFVGAKPVFADIEEETFGLDPDDVLEKITPKTKAILPIHFGGCPCKIREMREVAEDKGLLLIEDAAEALGAKIGNRKVGTFGNAAMLSFCQNKIITTGEGGAIVTNDREIHEKTKLIRSHGRLETCDYFSSTEIFDYISLGYNFRMSNITAALGVAQLSKADTIISMRRALHTQYIKKLKSCRKVITENEIPEDYFHVYQLFSVRVKNRDNLMKHLAAAGIMTKIYFPPVHATHFYKNVLKYDCTLPVTMRVFSDILSLPFYPGMPETDVDYVVDTIKGFYQGE
jgi:perosamine synthetase